MAGTSYRNISPSMCIAGTSENCAQSRPTMLPRSSSKSLSSSLPSIHTSKVRFADNIPIPVRAPDLQLKIVTPREDSELAIGSRASSTIAPTKSKLVITAHTSSVPNDDLNIPHPIDSAGNANLVAEQNPFGDPTTNDVEKPDVYEDSDVHNPFADDEHESDTASSDFSEPSTLSNPFDDAALTVHIVDSDNDVPPFNGMDLKETQSYFTALQHLFHPDVARQHYRARSGTLWTSASDTLKERHLSPLDMTEDEFVDLVLSQGNVTSTWMSENAQRLAHRMINRRIETSRLLARHGLAPSKLTDDFVDYFCVVTDSGKSDFQACCTDAMSVIAWAEKHMNLNDKVFEQLDAMSLFERATAIRNLQADILALEAVDRENAAIEATMQHFCRGEESTGVMDESHGDVTSTKNSPCKEISQLFEMSNSPGLTRKPSRLARLRPKISFSKLAKYTEDNTSSAAAVEPEASRSELDANTVKSDDQAVRDVNNLLFDEVPKSRFARLRSILANNLPHSLHRDRKKHNLEEPVPEPDNDSGIEADSDSSAKTIQTGGRARMAAPLFADITSPIRQQVVTIPQEEDPRRKDSGVGLSLDLGRSMSNDDGTVRIKRSDKRDSQDRTTDIRYIDDVFVEIPQQQLENIQKSVKQDALLHSSPSCFSLKRRNAFKVAHDGRLVTEKTSKEFEGKTVRKKISQVFGTRKSRRGASRSEMSRSSLGRKLFGRHALPEWDLSE